MKFSFRWLKDYVVVNIAAEKLAERLTMSGLEVESIDSIKKDKLIEVEVTPNRADCLSVLGIAREVSAILDQKLELPKIKKVQLPSKKMDITIEDKNACSRYTGVVINDVKIKPAVLWMQNRLKAVRLKPISNVVDITNFCLIETGQPLHAFDYNKISGEKIIVRYARKGESIVTLDGVKRDLDPSILVIADAEKPIAIAGIMGGQNTEITATTKNILLEAAHFDPVLIRRSSRKLGLGSDSSYRFECGVDFFYVENVILRALNLLLEQAGGKLVRYSNVVANQKKANGKVAVSLDFINSYIGSSLKKSACIKIFKKLGFGVKDSKDRFTIAPPSFRSDIKRDVDVVEEIARIVGYDRLPISHPRVSINSMQNLSLRKQREVIRNKLIAQGLDEVITYSLINEEILSKTFQKNFSLIKIKNPLSLDQGWMRPSLLSGMLGVSAANLNRGQKDLQIFELGKVYSKGKEKEALGILMTGSFIYDWRQAKQCEFNFYDLKGVLLLALKGANILILSTEFPFFTDEFSACVKLGEQEIGCLGKLSEKVLTQFSIKDKDVYFLEVLIDQIIDCPSQIKAFVPICEFPSVTRDVSLSVVNDLRYSDIESTVVQEGGELLKHIQFLEEYLGDKMEKGRKGIVFSLTYQSNEGTLKEDEVNQLHQKIIDSLRDKFQAVHR